MSDKITIYPAAALFNARETHFNSMLVEGLEKLGYKTNFPQRDGFEFGDLARALSGKIRQEDLSSALQDIIYFLDMGKFIPESDVILANFDEPLDEGVVVEASYSRLMGKFVLGLRTDVRSPYGPANGDYKGMHFFPAYQSNKFIFKHMTAKNPKEREDEMNSLVQKVDLKIQSSGISHQDVLPDYARKNPGIQFILEGARLLFAGLTDLHSNQCLEEIVSRYIENQRTLKYFY
jgi:nucleoside 2-deoxyribosyltransferase